MEHINFRSPYQCNLSSPSETAAEEKGRLKSDQCIVTMKRVIERICQGTFAEFVADEANKSDDFLKEIVDAISNPENNYEASYGLRLDLGRYGECKLEKSRKKLGSCGERKLEESPKGFVLKQACVNRDDITLAEFDEYELDHFINKLKELRALSDFFLVSETWVDKVISEFVVVDIDEKSLESTVSNDESTVCLSVAAEDLSEDDFIQVEEDSDYVPEVPKLGTETFSIFIKAFINKLCEKPCENYPEENGMITTPQCLVSTEVVVGKTAALDFINQYKNNAELVLAAYGVTERIIGEDHLVLLAVRGNESAIIDPKRGWFLGDAVADGNIKPLRWQGFFDTTNCGFYVYYMMTALITALLSNQFNLENTAKSLGSNLRNFFRQGQEPDPEEIRNEYYLISEQNNEKHQESSFDNTIV